MKIKTGFSLLPATYMVIAGLVFLFAWNVSNSLQSSIKFLIDGSIVSRAHLDKSYLYVVDAAQQLQIDASAKSIDTYLSSSKSEFISFERAFSAHFHSESARSSLEQTRQAAAKAWSAIENNANSNAKAGTAGLGVNENLLALGHSIEAMEEVYASEHKRVSADIEQERTIEILVYILGFALMLLLSAFASVAMRVNFFRPLDNLSAHIERMAKGDFSGQMSHDLKNELGVIYASVLRMQDSVSAIIHSVQQSISEVGKDSDLLSTGSADLSVRTEQQSAALGQTASSMQELSSTVTQNADNARQANELATSAHSVANHGGEIMDNVISRMSGIANNSIKIADIVSMIESIAFQTNILALNAAVEAARAGEQGKGFAVVAGEVRNLASRSSEAAKEIKVLIETASRDVSDGNKLVENAGKTMREIVSSVKRVATIMGEISAATNEQSRGIAQVNQAVSQMDEVTHRNAQLVQESTATAQHLKSSVARVNEAISLLRINESQSHSLQQELARTASHVDVSSHKNVQQGHQESGSYDHDAFEPKLSARQEGHQTKENHYPSVERASAPRRSAEPSTATIVSPLKKGSASSEGDWDSF